VTFAVDDAREDVLAHRGRIVHRLRDGAEPFDAQTLHVGVAEGRVQHHVGEDLQNRLERAGQRGDVRAGRIGIGLRAVARAQILESAGDGGRVASGRALGEKVERERGAPGSVSAPERTSSTTLTSGTSRRSMRKTFNPFESASCFGMGAWKSTGGPGCGGTARNSASGVVGAGASARAGSGAGVGCGTEAQAAVRPSAMSFFIARLPRLASVRGSR
jgi:hypothetical protein